MKNPLIFILDENNDYLRYGGTVKALEGYHDRVVVITPQPISATTFISVSMLPKNRNDNRYEQYLSPTSKKPSDYIASDDALSQTTLTWNVYEQDIKQDALLEFSQFRSGNISFAFAIQQISPSSKCVTYKGVFGFDNPLPTTGQTIGDYYECEDIDYSIESGTHTYAFSRGMLVYWNGSRYVKDRLKTLGGATAVDIPVEPNHAVGYELEDDETLAVEATIAQVVINENDIADLKQKDTDILDGTQPFSEININDFLSITTDGKDVIFSYRNINGELFKNVLSEAEPASGVTFEVGQVIQYAGTTGASGRKLGKVAVPSEINADPILLLGLVTQVSPEGYAIYNIYGVVNDLDTSAFSIGTVYFDSVNGGLTQTKPTAPNVQVVIGSVRRVHATNGQIEVFIDYGRKIADLHDMYFNSHTFVGGETIKYNITNQRWEIYDLDGNLQDIKDDITFLQEKFDEFTTMSVDGEIITEVINARDGEARLIDKINKIDTTNENNYKKQFYQKQVNTLTKEPVKPIISFVDDDGHQLAYNQLYPLFQSKGIKGALAIITSSLDTGGTITTNQLKEMHTNGWEILGHGHSYINNLNEFPIDSDLDYQLGEGCRHYLHNIGIEANGFVYPQSVYNLRIKRFVKKYFDFAFADTGFNSSYPYTDTLRIKRIALGYATSLNPEVNGDNTKNTLAYYKECVDYAVANNLWLTFMLHVGTSEMDPNQWLILSDLLDYINTLDVEVKTPTDAYKHFSNMIYIGDVEAQHMLFNDNGLFSSGGDGHIPFRTVLYNSILPSVGIQGYPLQSITKQVCTSGFASANGLPQSSAGLLITYHFVGGTADADFNRQEYWLRNNNNKYVRHAVSLSTWSSWTLINSQTQSYIISTDNLFSNSEPITSYTNNTVTSFVVYGAGTTGYPNNASGIVITYKQGGNLYYRQEFKQSGTNKTYSRYVDGTGAWTSWVLISDTITV